MPLPSKTQFDGVTVGDVINDFILVTGEVVGPNTEMLTPTGYDVDIGNSRIPNLDVDLVQVGGDFRVDLSGTHEYALFDQISIKSITRGSSDLIEEPSEDTSFNDIDPVEQQVFNYQPDPRPTITITITVYFDITLGVSMSSDSLQFTQVVTNNYDDIAETLLQYI